MRCPADHTHQWTVALRSVASQPTNGDEPGAIVGGKDDLSHFIRRVTFKLHESFASPNRGTTFRFPICGFCSDQRQ
jgi:YEATS domain-containing protein 4